MHDKQWRELNKKLMKPLMWSVLIAIAIYGGTAFVSDFSEVSASIMQLGVTGWGVILGLSLVNYGLRFVRWQMYLSSLKTILPSMKSLTYYLAGFAFTTTPGKAGEMVRSIYLKRNGMAYVDSLAAFFSERLIDLVAMLLLASFAAMVFPDYQLPVIIFMLTIVFLMNIIHVKKFHSYLRSLIAYIKKEKVRSLGLRVVDLLASASILLKSAPLYIGVFLALIAWGAEGVAFFVILEALDIQTSLSLAVGIYSVSVVVGAISFAPGGLGGTEAAMVILLKLVGVETSEAVAATLICRLATLWFAVLVGWVALAWLEFTEKA
jgi:uncharacterized protein (TIRG00374 family)